MKFLALQLFVNTGGWAGHFKIIVCSENFLLTFLCCAQYLEIEWSGLIALINSRIHLTIECSNWAILKQ